MKPPEKIYDAKYLVLIALGLFAGGYFLMIQGPMDSLRQLQLDEYRLRAEFERHQEKLVNVESYRIQVEELRHHVAEISRRLPDRLDLPVQERDLARSASVHGMEISSLRFADPADREFYSAQPFRLEASGEFQSLYYFLYDTFYAPGGAVTLGDFVIRRSPTAGTLLLTLEGSLFHYTDYPDG